MSLSASNTVVRLRLSFLKMSENRYATTAVATGTGFSVSRDVELDNVSFGRSLSADNAVDPPMLCVFADASQDAFGACAYIRHRKDDDAFTIKFIALTRKFPR